MKDRLVSGITATGKLTIGNYLGAIKNMIELQDKYEMFIFVADLHALTIGIDPKDLKKNREDIFALYLACGIDPHKSAIFFQSDIQEHALMNWFTQVNTTIGELSRMTQFKDKSTKVKKDNGTEFIPTGLLTYPTLMAGDILLYNPKIVPVGIDQTQHLELTRNIAKRFNKKYKTNFNNVQAYTPKIGAKIMGLVDPSKKMSKSGENPNDAIYLLDDPEVAYKKIMKAVTDSENKVYISEEKHGVVNLLTIYSSLKNIDIKEAEKEFENANYKDFKEKVAQEVKLFLEKIQIKYHQMKTQIDEISSIGKEKATAVAQETIKIMKKGIGL